jgi:hypothetical protein
MPQHQQLLAAIAAAQVLVCLLVCHSRIPSRWTLPRYAAPASWNSETTGVVAATRKLCSIAVIQNTSSMLGASQRGLNERTLARSASNVSLSMPCMMVSLDALGAWNMSKIVNRRLLEKQMA